MKWLIVMTATLVSLMACEAQGAPQPSAPYSTGKLIVTWTRGSPPNAANAARADRINMKCGPTPRQYTFPVIPIMLPVIPANPPEYSVNIRDVIPEPPLYPTTYYCLPVAAMGAIESDKVTEEFAFTVTVEGLPPTGDVTPPTVVIRSPTKGTIVPRKSTVIIDVTAIDDSGMIQDVVIFVNRASICRVTEPPYQCLWEVPAAAKRTYTLQASAGDAAGNRGLSPTIQVRSE
jgi:hypothetical protein